MSDYDYLKAALTGGTSNRVTPSYVAPVSNLLDTCGTANEIAQLLQDDLIQVDAVSGYLDELEHAVGTLESAAKEKHDVKFKHGFFAITDKPSSAAASSANHAGSSLDQGAELSPTTSEDGSGFGASTLGAPTESGALTTLRPHEILEQMDKAIVVLKKIQTAMLDLDAENEAHSKPKK